MLIKLIRQSLILLLLLSPGKAFTPAAAAHPAEQAATFTKAAALVKAEASAKAGARGTPGSPEFGIGATLYPQGAEVQDALDMAAALELDWLRVPLAWSSYQPVSTSLPRLENLDPVMHFAAKNHISVLVSLSDAPAWARTASGPDPEQTARFVLELSRRYPDAIQAVELFPGANTRAGWGGQPDPRAYYRLFAQVSARTRDLNPTVWLVAAGLRPQASRPPAGDMDDLEFLKGLYRQGASQVMRVISLQYDALTGDPLDFPDGSERRVFRHYEEIRQVMMANQHQNGLIWITHLSLPSGTIKPSDFAYQNLDAQASWMKQAYIQSRSQLYVGVTIGQSLNSEAEDAGAGAPSLLLPGFGGYHPFYSVLREIIGMNKNGGEAPQPGKQKEESFYKRP